MVSVSKSLEVLAIEYLTGKNVVSCNRESKNTTYMVKGDASFNLIDNKEIDETIFYHEKSLIKA